MGEDVQARDFSREDRQRYREKVKRCLDALRQLLEEGQLETGQHRVGLELEIYLVDRQGTPMMLNDEVLARIESDDWQTELAQFNIELNLPPRDFGGTVLTEMEQELRKILNHALEEADALDARMLIVGILPTLRDLHVTRENLSRNPRYHLLNDQILTMRGEDLRIEIEGSERLVTMANSITMEAASTSMQLHLQLDPDDFGRYWNAAQAIAAAQLAVGSNSPFFLGKKLWHETRIALFEQAIDTRTEELQAQGVRPRVWFGERWIDGVVELFEENVRYFPSLLPVIEPEDPLQQLERGEVPELKEMGLHNGTIYRWNRPVYDVFEGRPHIRLENRVLPAGPSVVDEIANAAFFYGLVRSVADGDPIHQQLSFSAATENFFAAAREGLATQLYWPTIGPTQADELVLDHLLPMAYDGLDAWGVDPDDRDRYLGIIEDRCRTGITGSTWQVKVAEKLHDEGRDRESALLEMTRRYIELMNANEPVHTWPLD
ncbi:MAG: glutamate--cysteine ligase [Actinobacteria bacterium]|nr:glutamate--cysteine ligase [Actinomycetota bacterium]